MANVPPAGWYPDPEGSGGLRYWDGSKWTAALSDPVVTADIAPRAEAAGSILPETESGDRERESADAQSAINDCSNLAAPDASDCRTGVTIEEPQAADATAIDGLPALKHWKSAPVFSVLGFFASFLLWNFFAAACEPLFFILFGDVDVAYAVGIAASWILRLALGIVYAFVFYLSYFSEWPKFKSSRVISFANYAMGGVIFGWCWTSNLRRSHIIERPEKGTSYIVATVFFSLAILLYIAQLFLVGSILSGSKDYADDTLMENYSLNDAASPEFVVGNNNRYFDEAIGASFILPEGWHQGQLKSDRQFLRFKAEPDDGGAYLIMYGAAEFSDAEASELTAEDFEGKLSEMLSGCEDEEVSRIEISGNEYWKVTGSGTNVQYGVELPVSVVTLNHFENDTMYEFQFFDYTNGENSSPYSNAFNVLTTSAVYE